MNVLILIHPAVTTKPELLESLKYSYTNSSTQDNTLDQHLINKLNDDSVLLPAEHYDVVHYLTTELPNEIEFPTDKLLPKIHKSLKNNNKSRFIGLSNKFKLYALIHGFDIVEGEQQNTESHFPSDTSSYYWVKKQVKSDLSKNGITQTATLLNRKTGSGLTTSNGLPQFKKKPALPMFKKKAETTTATTPTLQQKVVLDTETDDLDDDLEDVEDVEDVDDDDDDDDDATVDESKLAFFNKLSVKDQACIDEDDLIPSSDKYLENSTNNGNGNGQCEMLISKVDCGGDGTGAQKKRRRKACKDCTCGLKEQEDAELAQVQEQQNRVLFKLDKKDLTEIDFTIKGKKVGGCGSCALGDAFRCSGCPYLGLPAFKPGQQINLNSIADDL